MTPDHTPENPLEMRAWAFQERLLSCRTLVFFKHELLWERQSLRRSEWALEDCGPCRPYHVNPVSRKDKFILAAIYNYCPERIAPGFTKGLLSEPMHKLPVLSGVASRFHKITGHQYIAGL